MVQMGDAKRIFNDCCKNGWITEDVILMAKTYLQDYNDYDNHLGMGKYNEFIYQTRCLFSDALRDAGCHDEEIHRFIFNYGLFLAEIICKDQKKREIELSVISEQVTK